MRRRLSHKVLEIKEMGEICDFVPRSTKERRPLLEGQTATIMFFPGVRIERFSTVDEKLTAAPIKGKRERTVKRKVKSPSTQQAETQESFANK
jgi:hypothetical protein